MARAPHERRRSAGASLLKQAGGVRSGAQGKEPAV
jgi:hypothetical protein